ncbi:MAG: acetate--CoA ligase family protein [Candidatus Hodarchaeales archaeon]|jgi:succinyl-CoA synthetase beta subunit
MHDIIKSAINSNRKTLTIAESKSVFEFYGIPINKSIFIKNLTELEDKISNLNYPVVMKIVSPQITHKTDVNGVILNLRSVLDIKKAYSELIDRISDLKPDSVIDGIVIEEQIKDGLELIIGTFNDPVFGQTIMFGLGGILVEVLKDVSFRLLPINEREAYAMIEDIKSSVIIEGYRGRPGINKEELVNVMIKLSSLIESNPVKEIDINPLIAFDNKVVAVDARIILINSSD